MFKLGSSRKKEKGFDKREKDADVVFTRLDENQMKRREQDAMPRFDDYPSAASKPYPGQPYEQRSYNQEQELYESVNSSQSTPFPERGYRYNSEVFMPRSSPTNRDRYYVPENRPVPSDSYATKARPSPAYAEQRPYIDKGKSSDDRSSYLNSSESIKERHYHHSPYENKEHYEPHSRPHPALRSLNDPSSRRSDALAPYQGGGYRNIEDEAYFERGSHKEGLLLNQETAHLKELAFWNTPYRKESFEKFEEDEEVQPQDRKTPVRFIVSLVCVGVLCVVGWAVYRHVTSVSGPVFVRAETAPYRVPLDQQPVAIQDRYLYQRVTKNNRGGSVPPTEEHLLPPPEEPVVRPYNQAPYAQAGQMQGEYAQSAQGQPYNAQASDAYQTPSVSSSQPYNKRQRQDEQAYAQYSPQNSAQNKYPNENSSQDACLAGENQNVQGGGYQSQQNQPSQGPYQQNYNSQQAYPARQQRFDGQYPQAQSGYASSQGFLENSRVEIEDRTQSGTYYIQVGLFSTKGAADQEITRLRRQYARLFSDVELFSRRTKSGKYRVLVGSFFSKNKAQALSNALGMGSHVVTL